MSRVLAVIAFVLVASTARSQTVEQPSGDFEHTPAPEQKKDIPLPVFVEYRGSAHPASVVVRYAMPGSSSFRRLPLRRVGSGWGNVIPCGAVKLGTVRYYFQGLDGEGLPILDGGDKRHPYTVVVKDHLDGPPPHLPGRRAPTMCGEGVEDEDAPVDTRPMNTPSSSTKAYARFWVGVSGSIDFTVVPNGNDVCSRASGGGPTDPNWTCTSNTPEGIDFPVDNNESGTLVQGKAGSVNSGLEPANVRVKLTFDYAITQNLMVGIAFGFVAGAYQGGIAPRFPPIHIEARATWIFGAEPLSQVGFAPFVQLAGGVAEYDANLAITVTQNNIAGSRPVQAWHVGGPGFVALGGGVRFAFSPRVAMFLSARATAAFGASFFPAFGPELGLQAGL